MPLKLFLWSCLAMSGFGLVPVLRDPGGRQNVAFILFAVTMILMSVGFGLVSKRLDDEAGKTAQQ